MCLRERLPLHVMFPMFRVARVVVVWCEPCPNQARLTRFRHGVCGADALSCDRVYLRGVPSVEYNEPM